MSSRTFTCWLCGMLAAAAVAAALPLRTAFAQEPAADPFGAPAQPAVDPVDPAAENEDFEILTRGPVHEAFAEPVTFDPKPGLIVPKAPPQPIEEVAPEQRPESESVWIPGYWAWDEDRNDFLWVSGIWRSPPPDYLEWVPGYWVEVEGGSQWVSGYWGSLESEEVAYLPDPPASLEEGPSSDAPADDYFWVPGTWLWRGGDYVWRPGFWTEFRPAWIWVPARYVWTPAGCIFVDGYWDHTLEERGMLFAPVYYHEPIYTVADYYYSPSIVIDTGLLTAHLFARPHYCHYYFGDYYDRYYYHDHGIYPWFVFHERHYGYSSIYAHFRWGRHSHHYDDWRGGLAHRYRWYRDHDDWRPGHNWHEQERQRDRWRDRDRDDDDIDIDIENNLIAQNISDVDVRERHSLRETSREEREEASTRSRELREFERERLLAERESERVAEGDEPRRVRRERSPVAREGDEDRARQRRERVAEDSDRRGRAQRGQSETDLDVPGPRGDRQAREAQREQLLRERGEVDRGEPDEGGPRLREGEDDRPPSLRARQRTPPQGDGSSRGVLDPDEGARATGNPPGAGTDVDGAIRRGRQRQRETQQPGGEASRQPAPGERRGLQGDDGAAVRRQQQDRQAREQQREQLLRERSQQRQPSEQRREVQRAPERREVQRAPERREVQRAPERREVQRAPERRSAPRAERSDRGRSERSTRSGGGDRGRSGGGDRGRGGDRGSKRD